MRDLELKEKSEDTHLNWELGIWNAELMYSACRELLCRTVDFKISVAAGLKSLPARQRRINLRRAASLIEKET